MTYRLATSKTVAYGLATVFTVHLMVTMVVATVALT